ncbi:MAG TPA: HEAT repeat domain-containing protein [Candidatus Desulfaltia sp.]|nr:HEAT repeat domain-containing protein [Candidatus Desulfaltia sp.]
MSRQRSLAMIAALGLAGAAALGISQEVVRPPQDGRTLAARMDWAHKEASRRSFLDGYWTGYSIRRLMGKKSTIGSYDSEARFKPTLRQVIDGQKSVDPASANQGTVQEKARHILDDLEKEGQPEKKVWKDVAILFRNGNRAGDGGERVRLGNLDQAIDLEGLPLIWLGEAEDEESLSWLKEKYQKAETEKMKEPLLVAIGIHQSPSLVIPILASILESREPDALRKSAAFWLGQQNDGKAYDILMRTADKDPSREVRESAVFALSQLEIEESVDGLIGLARRATHEDVRHQAIFWLGQKASAKATATLETLAYESGEMKIQEQAVFALSQLPGNEGVDALIKVVKTHPGAGIRKKAIFWLGETGDPRALEVLVEIVKGK